MLPKYTQTLLTLNPGLLAGAPPRRLGLWSRIVAFVSQLAGRR